MEHRSRCKDSRARNGEVVNGAVEREFESLAHDVLAGERDALFWPAFPLGRLILTQGVIASVSAEEALEGIARHGRCDWGDLGDEDRALNNAALKIGERVLSRYRTGDGTAFYVITERDRSVTTILLPEEY